MQGNDIMYISKLSHFPTRTYCIAHETPLNVMWQPGGEGGLESHIHGGLQESLVHGDLEESHVHGGLQRSHIHGVLEDSHIHGGLRGEPYTWGLEESHIHGSMYIHGWSPFSVHLKLSQHCSLAIPQNKIKVQKN